MQMQKKLPLIIGIVLAVLAVFMIKVYLDQQRRLANEAAQQRYEREKASQTPVLVAKKDIPRGSMVEPDSLEAKIIPNQFIQPQAVTSLDRISGMVTIAPISKGEQITLSKLMWPKEVATGGSLATATPVGKRAITISVDNISALLGMIKPGDYVDVIALLPVPVQSPEGQQTTQAAVIPLFQNVLVLAIGQELGGAPREEGGGRYKKEEAQQPSTLITLALTPQEAGLIAFVQEQGKIRLTLRSPTDAKIEPVQPASWETLFQYIMPPEARQAAELSGQKPLEEKEGYVEIYRGLNKEKIPLSK